MSNSFQMAPITPGVKKLIILNVGIWLIVQIILDRFFGWNQWRIFILTPELVLEKLNLKLK